MRDIYLIDFENVASEGLSGITYLAPEDEVIIFYSNNSKSLSMKMHILIGKSVCKLDYFEAAVGGKNALDHQISTWLGYLVGRGAAERNYYIVSRDMGYKFVASFWSDSELKPRVRCVESIKAASRLERNRQQQRETAAKQAEPVQNPEQPALPMLRALEPVSQPHIASGVPEESAEEPKSVDGESLEMVPSEQAEPAPVLPEAEVLEMVVRDTTETAAEVVAAESSVAEPASEGEQEEQGYTKNFRGRQRYRRSRAKNNRPGNGAAEAGQAEPETDQIASKAPVEARAELEVEASPGQRVDSQPEGSAECKPNPEVKTAIKPNSEIKTAMKSEKVSEVKSQSRQRTARTPKKQEDPKPSRNMDLRALIAPYPGLQETHLRELIADNKRQVLCNTLRKQLGQEKGLALYNEIKKSAWRG